MRIAIVFSSPTPSTNEYENVWKKCPQSMPLDSKKLVIEGTDWKIFVFDGLEKQYHKVTWDYDRLSQEIFTIVCRHSNSPMGILLHGDDQELKTLVKNVQTFNVTCCLSRHYGSVKGKFYKEFVKPFSSGASDDLFQRLWAKLMDTPKKNESHQDISAKIHFLSHKLSGFARSLGNLIEDAEHGIGHFQEVNKFDFELLLQRYAAISSELMSYNISGVHDLSAEMEIIVSMSKELQNNNLSSKDALILARSCLASTEKIVELLNKFILKNGIFQSF